MSNTDFLLCTCRHRADAHKVLPGALDGRFRACRGSDPSVRPWCGCERTPSQILDSNMADFSGALQGEARDLARLASYYGVEASDPYDEAATRAEFLSSNAAAKLWTLYLHEEAPRTDELGERLCRLAREFPTLDRRVREEGLLSDGWSARELELFASGSNVGACAREAALFVLGVWDRHQLWVVGRFNFLRAFSKWDKEHRAAFAAWVEDPWWA